MKDRSIDSIENEIKKRLRKEKLKNRIYDTAEGFSVNDDIKGILRRHQIHLGFGNTRNI